MATPEHRVRIRDGEREVEVSGNPAFVRQLLDDLPALLERLRGAPAGRTAISMPPPPRNGATGAEPIPAQPAPVAVVETTAAAPAGGRRRTAQGSLEDRVLAVLAQSTEPLAVAAIRERLGDDRVSGQQVRRLLERAGPRVAVSGDRPATYSLP